MNKMKQEDFGGMWAQNFCHPISISHFSSATTVSVRTMCNTNVPTGIERRWKLCARI